MTPQEKVIVFDFDGVIVKNSERAKLDAWKAVFAKYVGIYERHFNDVWSGVGFGKPGDRFDIMREMFLRLGVTDVAQAVKEGVECFDRFVQEKIAEEGPAPGLVDVLKKLSVKYPLYVNSGTPEAPLQESVSSLGLSDYFKDILGRPHSKTENIWRISEWEHVSPVKIVLVGDSMADLIAKDETKCQFIGVLNEWNEYGRKIGVQYTTEGVQEATSFPCITHFEELEECLVFM